ncbi:hypothetical protein HDR58_05630 [bacterium]|nr:hypothetical protein [bacterium]
MHELRVFAYDESVLRTVQIGGEPWFVGKDVATALAYSNPRDALAKHVDEEDKGVAKCDTLGGQQDLTIINESGMYSLIFGSRLAEAKKFKRWVTSEVLPALRKTGAYSVGAPAPSPSDRTEALAALAKSLAEVRRLHKAGLVTAEDANRMARSAFGMAGAPVQDAHIVLDDSELATSVRAFFRERVAFRLVGRPVSSRKLYEAWREYSGAQNVTRRVFSGKVRRLFPSLVFKQLRSAENGRPEWHFCGIALRPQKQSKEKQTQVEANE